RTFQLLAQVAGRAGRAEKPGRVVVQTTMPDHPAVLRAAKHDFEGFAAPELDERRALGYPPFGRMLRVVASAPGEKAARDLAGTAADALRRHVPEAMVLGPAPAFLEQLRGKNRWHLLAKAPDARVLARAVAALRPLCRRTKDRDMVMDVEPMHTA
ncbi:MAG: replication restart helicase PriA, partial [Planctomycetota bacterium]